MTRPALSFEFFPPKDLPASFRLWDAVGTLAPYRPDFVSVTYGAGGTTRDLTRSAVQTLYETTGLPVAGHLTCVDASREETLHVAEEYAAAGVRDIVALRGDAPKGTGGFAPHRDGFASSLELIDALASQDRFNIHVGAYPETHPEAASRSTCINHLKAKFDAGATTAITQFFFEADTFLRFRDDCAAAGITAPIIPGILPVESWAGVQKFAASCGTHIPQVIRDGFDNATRDGTERLFATAIAAELCDELVQEGVERLHFYTLNRATLTRDVCHALGYTARPRLRHVA